MKNVKARAKMRFLHQSSLPFIWAVLVLIFPHLVTAAAAPLQEGPITEGVYFSEVRLRSFTAVRAEGQIVIRWETEVELYNAGFNVYRADHDTHRFVKVNDGLVATLTSGELTGAAYELADTSAVAGTDYEYWIESVDIQGFPTYLAQITALGRDIGTPEWPQAPFHAFLPMVSNG
jgi:hypothetical protein